MCMEVEPVNTYRYYRYRYGVHLNESLDGWTNSDGVYKKLLFSEEAQILCVFVVRRLPLPLSPSVPAGLTKWFTELEPSLPRVWSLLRQWGTGDQTNNNKLLSIMAVRLICLTQFYWGRRAGFSSQTSQNPTWACSVIHVYQEWNLSLRKGFVSEWEGCCKYFITPQL